MIRACGLANTETNIYRKCEKPISIDVYSVNPGTQTPEMPQNTYSTLARSSMHDLYIVSREHIHDSLLADLELHTNLIKRVPTL